MGHPSHHSSETSRASTPRTSPEPPWYCAYDDYSLKLFLVAKTEPGHWAPYQVLFTVSGMRNAPPVAPLHAWIWSSKPSQRIHIDFAGLFKGKSFLIIVDAHSKWLEVIEMTSMTSLATMQELRCLFSFFGLPEQLVSDNGPQFTSEEFASFLKGNGIKHIRSEPYHPSSNGVAGRFVQTFKRAMTTNEGARLTFQQQLMNFFSYRITPHATTNVAPSTLFLKRHVWTRFDLLHPEVEEMVAFKQAQEKWCRDQHSQGRALFVGQQVMVRNFLQGLLWIPGTIVECKGPLSYLVQISGGRIWHCHIDHLREMGDSPRLLFQSSSFQSPSFLKWIILQKWKKSVCQCYLLQRNQMFL